MERDTSKLVWSIQDNFNQTSSNYHCYYPRKRKTAWIGEEYEGVGALCNKKAMVSEDGESSISINELELDASENEFGRCQSCQKIYDKLTPKD